jgi:hypothetical protein
MKNERGLSLIDVVVSAALIGLVVMLGAAGMSSVSTGFRRYILRAQANLDARALNDAMTRFFGDAKAQTVEISTPDDPEAPLNSSLVFETRETDNAGRSKRYNITWSTSPARSVLLNVREADGLVREPKVLARNINTIRFDFDSRDPGIVRMSYRIVAPIDQSGLPERTIVVSSENREYEAVAGD